VSEEQIDINNLPNELLNTVLRLIVAVATMHILKEVVHLLIPVLRNTDSNAINSILNRMENIGDGEYSIEDILAEYYEHEDNVVCK